MEKNYRLLLHSIQIHMDLYLYVRIKIYFKSQIKILQNMNVD